MPNTQTETISHTGIRSDLAKIALGFGMITTLCGGILLSAKPQLEFELAYNRALVEYADTNSDSIISDSEKKYFIENFLDYHEVSLVGGTSLDGCECGKTPELVSYNIDLYSLVIDNKGYEVPVTTLIDWLKEYNPSK